MSAVAVAGPSSELPPDALAAVQRVQRLQTLIAQVKTGSPAAGGSGSGQGPATAAPAGASSPASAGSFAAALQAASAPTTGPAGVPYPSAGLQYATSASAPAAAPTAATATGAGAGSTPYDALIDQAATRYGVDPAVLHGLIEQESGFDPNATSSAGAQGLTQLMPGTASSLGVANPLDPAQSIEGGARYLGQLMSQFGGNVTDALAAYNAGPGAVQQYGGVPPYAETQSYVAKVLGNAEAYRQTVPGQGAAGQIPATAPVGSVA